MPPFLRLLALTFCFGLATSSWSIQVTIPLTNTKPEIDGTVSATEKQNAASVDLIKVGGLDKPRFPTKVYTAATYDGLYVGFVAEEPHTDNLVTSTTQENGAVFDDDSVQILISPTLDTAADSYYHFAVNANGVRYSNYLLTGDTLNDWQTSVARGKTSWEAEFFIPLDTIKAPDELPYWRANFARHKPVNGDTPAETTAWVNPGISLHNYKKFGYMTMPRFVPPAPGATSETTSTVTTPNSTSADR